MSLRVIIAGGGIGGLALAQGLRKVGVDVTVYERDPSPTHRPQGYRLHIDAGGHQALEKVLPADLFELYVATSTRTPKVPLAVFFNQRFEETRVGDTRAGDADPERGPTAVDRLVLRQILLSRLADTVRFGHEVVGYESGEQGVRVHLSDGGTVDADLLVGADGIRSVIRDRLLPHAKVHDTGVRAIAGKTPLDRVIDELPERMFNSFTGIHSPDMRTLATGIFQPRQPIGKAAAELASDVALDPPQDYLMWVQLARVEDYPINEQQFWTSDGTALHGLALRMLDGWHPGLRRLVEHADASSAFPLAIHAVLPVEAWPSGNVTLLGDAIHAMTPIGGRGANTALLDAALLTRQLETVRHGGTDLLSAITEYETQMRGYGYEAVIASLRNAAPTLGARSPYGAAPVGARP